MKPDPTMEARFAAAARAGIDPITRRTWDPRLPRDPRLLVPVDVRALVVGPGEKIEHALTGSRLLGETAPDARAHAPFSDGDPRPPGVYLHWALPDGLTQATTAPGASAIGLRPLPDRWVVVRIEGGVPRRVRAWVLESEKGSRTALDAWPAGPPEQGPRTPAMRSADLTAAAGGDPAWAAVWDDVEDRFALHDDLADAADPGGTFSYLVAGWYSAPELDPLHLGPGDGSFDELMTRLGWQPDRARLEEIRAEMARRRRAAATVGLASPDLLQAGRSARVDPSRPGVVPHAAPRKTTAADDAVHVPVTAVPAKLLAGAGAVAIKSAPWCPQQSLYHGAIHGVTTDPDRRADPRPAAGEVRASIGATGTESLAALLAAELPGDDALQERLQTAFAYGLIDELEDPDGVARVEAELHARAFVSEADGGFREERIRAGDAIAPLRGSAAPAKDVVRNDALLRTSRELEARSVRFEPLRAKRRDLLDAFTLKTAPGRVTPPPDPLRFETVRRALPRWYYPQDPVLTLRGLRRSLRHGFDGRFEAGETLACRLSGDPVTALHGLLDGRDLAALAHGGIPDDVADLLAEAVLEDPDEQWLDTLAAHAAKSQHLPVEPVRARLEAEQRLVLQVQRGAPDVARLLPGSLRKGVLASPVAFTPFRQAWVPLYAEWRLELALDDRASGWTLGELDFEPAPGERAAGPTTTTVTGRSLLTAAAARAFDERVTAYLTQEEQLDRTGVGEISPEVADALRDLAGEARFADVLTGAFERVREHLLGFDTDHATAPTGEPDAGPAAPVRPPVLLRAGTARLRELRVVDAFGRTLDVPQDALGDVVLSEALQVPSGAGDPGEVLLPPRFTAPSRLRLTLLDGADDGREATIDQEDPSRAASPVAGWLLPDHVDGALEVFDASGEPIGQLRHESLSGAVVWEGAPGRPEPVGAPPPPELSRHARAFATELVRTDARARAEGRDAEAESALAALLRVVDTTLWTVDPFGRTGTEHLALLVGRPIAMVRAELCLEVRADTADHARLDAAARAARDAAFAALADRAFDVRLGALARQDDGLLGYFVDDDYTRLYPVHPSVLAQALPAGPHEGFLGPVAETPAFAAGATPQPIAPGYAIPDPTVTVRPGQVVRLTLLMDPGHAVNVSSGVLPRKQIALLRDWIAPALTRLAPSFRIGPVLVDPETIRLPQPSALGSRQAWTRRDGAATWRDDPIVAATQDALLPDTAAGIQEGYIRVREDPPPDS